MKRILSIRTKYLSPTNTKSGRIKATDSATNKSVTIDFDHALGTSKSHGKAAFALARKLYPKTEAIEIDGVIDIKDGNIFTIRTREKGAHDSPDFDVSDFTPNPKRKKARRKMTTKKTARKPRKKIAARKARVKKAAPRANPATTRVNWVIAASKAGNFGYWTGADFDTDPTKAKIFSKENAVTKARDLRKNSALNGWTLIVTPILTRGK